MKIYKKVEAPTIQACQYGNDKEAKKFIEECVVGKNSEVISVKF